MGVKLKRILAGLGAAMIMATTAVAQEFPVVFEDKAMLRELGVTLADVGPQPDVEPFAEKCFYYGDGGHSVSLSPELIARFTRNGFSVGAICLGILSGIRYHPTTGERLATFMVADVEAIRAYGPDPFAMSEELPLELPACYAGARPLSDCDWRFDPKTGAALSEDVRTSIRNLGLAADAAGEQAVASGVFNKTCPPDSFGGDCRIDKFPGGGDFIYIEGRRAPERVANQPHWPVGMFDISSEYPAGFGYALFTDGAAGPSAQIDADKIALDPKKRASMAIIESLKVKLK